MLNPNDKVVCINAVMPDADAALFSERLVNGAIYSIRDIDPEQFHDGLQSVHLVGIQGHVFPDGSEVGFCSDRFRKIGEAHATTVQTNNNEETL